jgi:hypothetical protein
MHTPGAAAHSLSAMQPRQVFVDVAQMGVVPEQVLLPVHCTQAPLLAQAGVALFLVAHWLAAVQAVQISFAQMGVAPEHPALVRHWTHLFAVVSQTGVLPEQVLLSMHATHCPALVPLVAQAGAAGFLARHWPAVVQAVQLLFAQMGVAPEHPALVRHATHLLVAVSQTGVLPEQVLLSVHWTQVPLAEQAGAAGFLARHWAGVLQTVQTFAAQMGVAAAHVALVRHCTHCPPTPTVLAGAQTIPAQAPAPACSHPTQALPTQNARAGSLQSVTAAHSAQTPAIHTGRPAWQSPFTLHPGAAVSTATSAAVSTDASESVSGAATGAVSEAVSGAVAMPVSGEMSRAPPSGCSTQRKSGVQTKPSAHGAASPAHLVQSRSTLLQAKSRQRPKMWRARRRVTGKGLSGGPCFMVAPRRWC